MSNTDSNLIDTAPECTARDKAYQWIIKHDESKLFNALYITLAVVLSIAIGLFWLVAVVGIHFCFELIRQQSGHPDPRRVFAEALWELKLDLALVLFAFVISLYIELVLGLAGLGGATRLGVAAQASLRTGSRIAAWQRIIRGILLTLDDVGQVLRVASFKKNKPPTQAKVEANKTHPNLHPVLGRWLGKWSWGDRLSVALGGLFFVLTVLSPMFTDHSFSSALVLLTEEMHPLPFLQSD